ncbi:MAG: hypothetical protein GF408_01075 [Candidatus Omnitrophica bacterium]|nr:hypothetical protein [Candidatus Omnitrophota bacterium]
MKETGYIVEIKDNELIIEIRPHEACSKCCSCGAGKKRQMTVSSSGISDPAIGDKVGVEIDDSVMLRVYGLVYGIPLVIFTMGIVLSYLFLTRSPGVSFLVGLILMGASFFLTTRVFKNNPKYSPRVTRL